MDSFNLMSGMFSIVPVFIIIIFIIIFAIIIINMVKGVKRWSYNNAQPVLTVDARVVAKRTDVSSSTHHDANNMSHHHTYTSYYATFEVESGDRMEFKVMDDEYGMLVEGDKGKLTFQGTRYKGFKRYISEDKNI